MLNLACNVYQFIAQKNYFFFSKTFSSSVISGRSYCIVEKDEKSQAGFDACKYKRYFHCTCFLFPFSAYHRIVGTGRNLWRSMSPTPALKQVHYGRLQCFWVEVKVTFIEWLRDIGIYHACFLICKKEELKSRRYVRSNVCVLRDGESVVPRAAFQ